MYQQALFFYPKEPAVQCSIANGSELHRKAVEEMRPHSMNLIKNGTCQNDICASETNVGLLPHEELPYQ